MKSILALTTILLLVLAATLVGCTSAPETTTPPSEGTTPPPETAPEQPPTGGTLEEVSPEEGTVTVQTPQGYRQTLPIGPGVALTLEGQACTVEDLEALVISGESYYCTVVYDEVGDVVAVNVVKVPPAAEPTSVTGSISDVNIEESTVTVQTAEGPKVFQVDQNTGLLIGGEVCSLELISALAELEGALDQCTVIYDVNEEGKALYIDVASPPEDIVTQYTGVLTQVDIPTSTVTIETDTGPRTYEVNAETGMFLHGEVCSLTEIQDEFGAGPNCEVLYYTDSGGKLVYMDITEHLGP